MRRLFVTVVALTAVLLAYPAWLAFQIWEQSRQDELGRAGAIVVLGAAQYNGRPSPIFKARLDHATYLYREGFSNLIILTGGKRAGDEFTEAEAGEGYLESRGISSQDIATENAGRTTLESLRKVRKLARDLRVQSLLLVSDPLHSERIKRIAQDLGFERVYASPASYLDLRRTRATKAIELLREVASLSAYELLGARKLPARK